MYRLFIVLAALRAVAGGGVNILIPDRIIGGQPIPIISAPYQVAIMYNGQFICGGSILSRRFILSAAHCFDFGRKELYKIRAGSRYHRWGGQERRVSKVEINAYYNTKTHDHDAAVIKLRYPLIFGKKVQPVNLPTKYQPSSRSAVVSGWGLTKESGSVPARGLRAVRVNFLSVPKCRVRYGSQATITRNMICAGELKNGGKDSCQGDSGGPLVQQGVQYGIVSFGVGCARKRFPGVYTSVFRIKRWIRKVMKNM